MLTVVTVSAPITLNGERADIIIIDRSGLIVVDLDGQRHCGRIYRIKPVQARLLPLVTVSKLFAVSSTDVSTSIS